MATETEVEVVMREHTFGYTERTTPNSNKQAETSPVEF